MLVEKAGAPSQNSRAGAGRGHVLCHPHEPAPAQVVEVVQLNRGLQLPSPAGQMLLQALNLGGQRSQKGREQVRSSARCFPHPSQGPQEEAGVGEHHLKMGRQLERPRPSSRPEDLPGFRLWGA